MWLAPLAAWVLLSGLDDLLVTVVFVLRVCVQRFPWPCAAELDCLAERRIAVFVPLWQEHDVIGRMLEHNLAAVRYTSWTIFAGVYPNDDATARAVQAAAARMPGIEIAVCGHDGPTSKADCLNWIYARMQEYERDHGVRFEIVVTHDAEDLMHPESLRLINRFSREYGMVQVPVLPLPTPPAEITHGLYCDEFAEYQTKDIPVRQYLGGFLPSNGVGTGFAREVLEQFKPRIFQPECLTEDYENGFRIHRLGVRQIFIPLHGSPPAATREFFPRSVRSAVRQRIRWITGITLQGWERHGWRVSPGQLYWLWRDRKGLVGNPVSLAVNLWFVASLAGWGTFPHGVPLWIWLFVAALSAVQISARAWCVGRIYGWGFAAGVPLRAVWGNCLNGLATALALVGYARARLARRPLPWLKTQHVYPSRTELMPHKRRLGEILLESGWISEADLERALRLKPRFGERLGERLVEQGTITETQLYPALARQQGLTFGAPSVHEAATRSLPAAVARRWKVLPFQVRDGSLMLASPELPCDGMFRDIGRFCPLELRLHLVTPAAYEKLARRYLR